MTDATATKPTFHQVYSCLQRFGPATVTSSRGTVYEVRAVESKGVPTIVGYPQSGQVRIHEDCWGENQTCKRTWAGGIFNGNPSIYDWYYAHCE